MMNYLMNIWYHVRHIKAPLYTITKQKEDQPKKTIPIPYSKWEIFISNYTSFQSEIILYHILCPLYPRRVPNIARSLQIGVVDETISKTRCSNCHMKVPGEVLTVFELMRI